MMYKKIKKITRTGRSTSNIGIGGEVKDKKGLMLTDPEEVRGRWKEYVEELYDMHKKPKMEALELELEEEVQEDSKGPELIEVELKGAMENPQEGKAGGCDGIPADIIKVLGGDRCSEVLMCRRMYDTGKWPEEFTRTVMIPLPKKPNARECADFRTVSLIPHAFKIMLQVLTKRI